LAATTLSTGRPKPFCTSTLWVGSLLVKLTLAAGRCRQQQSQ
jgi:hypothetical protein